ncbi:ribonuclease HI family protein [Verrucomicrobium sp. 3C]|uniref:ribonuclease HI family protein n=1 Tax=Verrucomicrobium sp. 3C TaxID=1134055 RepID=UPI0018CB10B6|nr:ribonuclease HI family protein [Verrucomicrobium sp. 3C]
MKIFSDGACAGNPGPMGIGGLLLDGGRCVERFSQNAGHGTNNEAEYLAVIRALELAVKHSARAPVLHADSQLIVNQLNGGYAVRQPSLQRLHRKAVELARRLPGGVRFVWIPREQNTEADALASQACGIPQAPITERGVEVWKDASSRAASVPEDAHPGLKRFLSLSDPRFRDYAKLRVGGRDAVSRLKTERLIDAIRDRHGPKAASWIEAALRDGVEEPFGKTALRWCARGLPPDKALKKAAVDKEMAELAKRGRSGR